jgi:hypothetical protein
MLSELIYRISGSEEAERVRDLMALTNDVLKAIELAAGKPKRLPRGYWRR